MGRTADVSCGVIAGIGMPSLIGIMNVEGAVIALAMSVVGVANNMAE